MSAMRLREKPLESVKTSKLDQDLDDEIEGKQAYGLEEKLESDNYNAQHVINMETGFGLQYSYIQKNGFDTPILVKNKTDLGITVPDKNISLRTIQNLVGPKRIIDVMNAETQATCSMTMAEWCEYYLAPIHRRAKILNVISLEFSGTPLDPMVHAPSVVRDMDWVERVWPPDLRYVDVAQDPQCLTYPKVVKYCLMSVAHCYTDFHIDLGGTSVWYHILRGSKIFWLIPPTEANLKAYEEWSLSGVQEMTFLADKCEGCQRVVLAEGNTFFIPTGWIHAVYTPVDSLVFGGNFLHSFNIGMQLRVAAVEQTLKVPARQRYPFFDEMQWYLYDHYNIALNGTSYMTAEDEPVSALCIIPAKPVLTTYELKGLRHLREWLGNQPKDSWPEDLADASGLLRSMMVALAKQTKFFETTKVRGISIEKHTITGEPLLQWQTNMLINYKNHWRSLCNKSKGPGKSKPVIRPARTRRCNVCKACQAGNCQNCPHCKDMIKYGGPGKLKQACLSRICLNPHLTSKRSKVMSEDSPGSMQGPTDKRVKSASPNNTKTKDTAFHELRVELGSRVTPDSEANPTQKTKHCRSEPKDITAEECGFTDAAQLLKEAQTDRLSINGLVTLYRDGEGVIRILNYAPQPEEPRSSLSLKFENVNWRPALSRQKRFLRKPRNHQAVHGVVDNSSVMINNGSWGRIKESAPVTGETMVSNVKSTTNEKDFEYTDAASPKKDDVIASSNDPVSNIRSLLSKKQPIADECVDDQSFYAFENNKCFIKLPFQHSVQTEKAGVNLNAGDLMQDMVIPENLSDLPQVDLSILNDDDQLEDQASTNLTSDSEFKSRLFTLCHTDGTYRPDMVCCQTHHDDGVPSLSKMCQGVCSNEQLLQLYSGGNAIPLGSSQPHNPVALQPTPTLNSVTVLPCSVSSAAGVSPLRSTTTTMPLLTTASTTPVSSAGSTISSAKVRSKVKKSAIASNLSTCYNIVAAGVRSHAATATLLFPCPATYKSVPKSVPKSVKSGIKSATVDINNRCHHIMKRRATSNGDDEPTTSVPATGSEIPMNIVSMAGPNEDIGKIKRSATSETKDCDPISYGYRCAVMDQNQIDNVKACSNSTIQNDGYCDSHSTKLKDCKDMVNYDLPGSANMRLNQLKSCQSAIQKSSELTLDGWRKKLFGHQQYPTALPTSQQLCHNSERKLSIFALPKSTNDHSHTYPLEPVPTVESSPTQSQRSIPYALSQHSLQTPQPQRSSPTQQQQPPTTAQPQQQPATAQPQQPPTTAQPQQSLQTLEPLQSSPTESHQPPSAKPQELPLHQSQLGSGQTESDALKNSHLFPQGKHNLPPKRRPTQLEPGKAIVKMEFRLTDTDTSGSKMAPHIIDVQLNAIEKRKRKRCGACDACQQPDCGYCLACRLSTTKRCIYRKPCKTSQNSDQLDTNPIQAPVQPTTNVLSTHHKPPFFELALRPGNTNNILNYESLMKIFTYLTQAELVKCAHVCKAWRLASRSPNLWRSVTIKSCIVDEQMAWSIGGLNPRCLTLHRTNISHNAFRLLYSRLTKLECLRADAVATLASFDLSLLPMTLTELQLVNIPDLNDSAIMRMFHKIVTDPVSGASKIAKRQLQIYILNLDGSGITDAVMKYMARYIPRLSALSVRDCPGITNASFKYLTGCPSLVVLDTNGSRADFKDAQLLCNRR